MNRPLTAEYIVELFDSVIDSQSESDWKHNKKRFIELIKEYGTEQCNIADVVRRSEQYFCCKDQINQRCSEQCLGCFQFENKD